MSDALLGIVNDYRQLIGVQSNARTERGLEQVAVRCRGGAPLERAQKRAEDLGVVGAVARQIAPGVLRRRVWRNCGSELARDSRGCSGHRDVQPALRGCGGNVTVTQQHRGGC